MLSKNINNLIGNLLLSFFQKIPIRLINRFLWSFHRNPTLGDKWGYYIRKFHYYYPLPNFSDITQEQVLKRRILTAIDWNLIEKRLAWNEQYMLEAFLAYNSHFEVVLANHWLSVDYPQEVARIWPGVVN